VLARLNDITAEAQRPPRTDARGSGAGRRVVAAVSPPSSAFRSASRHAPRATLSLRCIADAVANRGTAPAVIQRDHGTEFTSTALDHWAKWTMVQLDCSRPGHPMDNSPCEAFNDSARREGRLQHWFASLTEAQVELNRWRTEYNNERPHISLGHQAPSSVGGAGIHLPPV
jgi:putative transposase